MATLAAEWPSAIAALSFSPDGTRVAAASTAGEIKVWNAVTFGGGILRRGGGDVDRAAVSGGGRVALHNVQTQTLEVWDALQRKLAWKLTGNETRVVALAFSPDGGRLATGSTDNVLRIWNAASGQATATAGKRSVPITSLAFSADGARLVAGSADHAVSVWDGASVHRIFSATVAGSIRVAVPSPDGKRIAGGGEGSGDIEVWDAGSGQLLAVLKGHSAAVDALAFSPDGSRIVSGSRDKSLRVWDAATYDPLLVMGDHEEAIASVAFSPDGARIYSASPEGTVRVWETRTGAEGK
jgi:WD40 repeat protein